MWALHEILGKVFYTAAAALFETYLKPRQFGLLSLSQWFNFQLRPPRGEIRTIHLHFRNGETEAQEEGSRAIRANTPQLGSGGDGIPI